MTEKRMRLDIFHKPWAILPEVLQALAAPMQAAPAWIERSGRLAASAQPTRPGYGAVAVIPIYGVITYHSTLRQQIFGGTSIQMLTAQFRQALRDNSIGAIVFDVDSPGGEVEGIQELADEIFAARRQKKTIAVANCLAASAAYWLASSASELVASPSAQIGSIGVVSVHQNISGALEQEGVKVSLISAGRFKTEGNPLEPLSDEARAYAQQKLNTFYEKFVGSVARGRHADVSTVRGGFGQGRTVLASQAMATGMVDREETLDQVLARLTTRRSASPRLATGASRISMLRMELDLITRHHGSGRR